MTFQADDNALLIDAKGRRYLVRLQRGNQFHYHQGIVDHDTLIGSEPGRTVTSTGGGTLLVIRPRLSDFILKMPRGATVIYPKDLGPIAVHADIAPGMTVLEAGTGSGALTLALLRFVGPGGKVVSVERRDDHAAIARRSIVRWLGELPPNLDLLVGEVEDIIPEVPADRLVLDLPEPWHAVAPAAAHLPGGSIFCAYLPTVPQLQNLTDALRASGAFAQIEVFETLHRTWTVAGRSVRPDHRMVGHTGFITVATRVAPMEAPLGPSGHSPQHSLRSLGGETEVSPPEGGSAGVAGEGGEAEGPISPPEGGSTGVAGEGGN
ncbi:MAG: tRNA (adenine-N1)-methyltransferase [Acidimicrobiia bacterium]